GEDIALLSIGTRLAACLDAAEKLAADGVKITVADARFAKPLDTGLLAELAQNHKYLLIVEEGSPGGFAAHAINYLANQGHLDDGCRVRSVTLPDMFIDHDSQEGQLADAGLDAAGILHSLHSLDSLDSLRTVAGLDKKSPAKAGKAGAK
ncbi:MAG: 1-deoxy-D-xylulose-5-phosphate synthase, partial [Candidatus Puniceispirillum sp.]|nr:1-deoxy-D-xylulose-5-phosphate synthase [Candidatus Puniceispirillum sp.]